MIIGAGVTGLSAGWASGLPIYEAEDRPGGICFSYYICPGETRRLTCPSEDGEAYRFELGGGHWVFGGNPLVLRFIQSITPVKSYVRKSAVYFPDQNLFVPYPIQNHLRYLGQELAAKALIEIVAATLSNRPVETMADWLQSSFGTTLCELFFFPFHELYTAGLYKHIAPQDSYKSPIDLALVIQGAFNEVPPVGYNATFVYPAEGLGTLVRRMAGRCNIHYGKKVTSIDVKEKAAYFEDGSSMRYEILLSTLPLNRMMGMTGLTVDEEPDPSTSVLVVNIGALKGPLCPDYHWVYIPRSKAGFHRVGFYSNVDVSFLPASARESDDRVGIYVEKAYPEGQSLSKAEMKTLIAEIINELQAWGWIGEVEVVDPTWIDVAYTWSRPGSRWTEKALKALEKHDIYQAGRFARWVFQGITDSIKEGLVTGAAFKR